MPTCGDCDSNCSTPRYMPASRDCHSYCNCSTRKYMPVSRDCHRYTVPALLTNKCPPQETVMIPVSSHKPSVVSMKKGMKKCGKSFCKRIINSQWHSNKEVCCSYTQNKSLPELSGMMNETTLGKRSKFI